MRMPNYLSPSSISLWGQDRQEFYLKYLTENRPPRMPQTEPMSVGSAFDAYVKAYLVERLRGPGVAEFEFETIFEQQVSEHNRDFAREAGNVCFEAYRTSGALRKLLDQLEAASTEPRFEFTAVGTIEGVPISGKPDLAYHSADGAHVIVDWKVNGYCAKNGVSPKRGYVICRDSWKGKQSRSHNKAHKDAQIMHIAGLDVNIAQFFEEIDESWARQLSTYAWMGGEEVGSNFIICIEQLACKPGAIRVASHRARPSQKFQFSLVAKIVEIWAALNTGHIFDDMSREENDKLRRSLDQYYKAFEGGTEDDKWFTNMIRQH